MLEAVEDEEQALIGHVLGQSPLCILLYRNAQDRARCREQLVGARKGLAFDKPDAVRKGADHLARHLARQSGFAHAADAADGDQPLPARFDAAL